MSRPSTCALFPNVLRLHQCYQMRLTEGISTLGAVKAVAEATRAAMIVYFIVILLLILELLTSCERVRQVMALGQQASGRATLTHDVRRDLVASSTKFNQRYLSVLKTFDSYSGYC